MPRFLITSHMILMLLRTILSSSRRSLLSHVVMTSHMLLLTTCSVAGETEERDFKFSLILVHLNLRFKAYSSCSFKMYFIEV